MSDKKIKDTTTGNTSNQAQASAAKKEVASVPTSRSINTEIKVIQVPKITVDTGLDIVTLSSFFITALIVVATTIFTYKSSKKTNFSQESIANARDLAETERLRAEKRASNRQEWINTLRSDIAAFIGAVMNSWNLHQMQVGRASYQQSLDDALKWQESSKWAYEYNISLRELKRLKAKIKLLLNPTEHESIDLMILIDKAADAAESGHSVISECDEIITASQPILKKEWEKVKALQ